MYLAFIIIVVVVVVFIQFLFSPLLLFPRTVSQNKPCKSHSHCVPLIFVLYPLRLYYVCLFGGNGRFNNNNVKHTHTHKYTNRQNKEIVNNFINQLSTIYIHDNISIFTPLILFFASISQRILLRFVFFILVGKLYRVYNIRYRVKMKE